MVNGWFVFTIVTCIVICSGFVLAIALMRASWASREREALTSSDLRALEESALVLIEQLKSEADAGIGEMDKRCADLKELIAEADRKIRQINAAATQPRTCLPPLPDEVCVSTALTDPDDGRVKVLELAAKGMECADIARTTGLDAAEVKLILKVRGQSTSIP